MRELRLSAHQSVHTDFNMVACIGYFDGFHQGHQTLFNRTLYSAKTKGLTSAIISFEPDPWSILKPDAKIQHLSTLDDRKQLASDMGFDVWIVIEFDEAMAKMTHVAFIERLKALGITHLVCGFDFKFGAKGQGDVTYLLSLKNEQFEVDVCEEFKIHDEKVSTTRIKKLLSEGNVELANHLLGRQYQLKGVVVRGRQIGRKMGYPTANLGLDPEYFTPRLGVYVGYVSIEGLRFQAMISVGLNPTVKDDTRISVEAHILDFDRDIYDATVSFIFVHYLRPEEKYDGLDSLMHQIRLDEAATRRYFSHQSDEM
jgi:riboflavin kinase/FMN adenylyltransferase